MTTLDLGRTLVVAIISYNQPTYLKSMVSQVRLFSDRILVIDNASTFPPLLEYYSVLEEEGVEVLRMDSNRGHTVYLCKKVQERIAELSKGTPSDGWYVLTDPDLILPQIGDLISTLTQIAIEFGSNRVGPALEINHPDIRRELLSNHRNPLSRPMIEWEGFMYLFPISSKERPDLPIYKANIDTTFCLINTKLPPTDGNQYRVGGAYTAKHRPWYKNWRDELLPGEYETYRSGNISSNYFV